MGNPISEPLVIVKKGDNDHREQGNWVHPHVALNLLQWCSLKFTVWVIRWLYDCPNSERRGRALVRIVCPASTLTLAN